MIRTTTKFTTPFRKTARYGTDISRGEHTAQLRELLRHTAQPVAVVTAKMPSKNNEHPYHGATLSSFTSIAMDPYPLICFSLRTPSRMANLLKGAHLKEPSHMAINLLSAEQASIAVKFSRADLYPEPFFSVPYSLTQEGFPILRGCLGSISCKLVSKALPLHDLEFLERGPDKIDASDPGGAVISELFIAQVLRVEELDLKDTDPEDCRTLPLLYHRRSYTSCHPITSSKSQ